MKDVEKNDKDASKPAARYFDLHNHFKQHMAICGLSRHQGTTEILSHKNLEQKLIFQIGTLNPHGIGRSEVAQGTGASFKCEVIDKLTPSH